MTRYTDSIVAAVRQRYENTNQTLHSIAAEFQISTRNLSRMAAENGWAKRRNGRWHLSIGVASRCQGLYS